MICCWDVFVTGWCCIVCDILCLVSACVVCVLGFVSLIGARVFPPFVSAKIAPD
jgi:hypothetical protein